MRRPQRGGSKLREQLSNHDKKGEAVEHRESIHGEWSSRWVFVLAAAGSAVGLGNIWKFPYIAGENGGGAFVLVYLLCIALVGIPIMMAEVLLGRRGRRSPINTLRFLTQEGHHHPAWEYLGWAGVVAGFLILSYYSVIAGWALSYLVWHITGTFQGIDAAGAQQFFADLTGSPERLLAWHTIFMVMTTLVVARGVRSGLEQAVRVMMPALFVLLLVLVGYAATTGHFGEGLAFLFTPDFHRLSGNSVLIALGHAFFTLSLGMGAIMVYGSYMPHGASISRSTLMIAGADTLVALLAGMAIFPVVFANGLEPGAGPGLLFQTLPLAFGQMPWGSLFGALFFLLVTFAAWTSAISLVEPTVAWLVENHGFTRAWAALATGLAAWVLGLATIFSFNIGADWTLFAHCQIEAGVEVCSGGKTAFDLLDYLTSNIMLPLGGLVIALFAGWVMQRRLVQEELRLYGKGFEVWYFVLRYLSPVAMIVVFLGAIGIL